MQGFLSRDGIPPADLLKIAREQLVSYGVQFRQGLVEQARRLDRGFELVLASGENLLARKVLLCTGLVDELPKIDGFQSLWGRSAFICPYCHGWEVQDSPLAVYGKGQAAFDLSLLLTGWSHDLVLCTDGPDDLSDEQRRRLSAIGISIRQERIQCLRSRAGLLETIEFENNDLLARAGIFLRPKPSYRTYVAERLGCQLTEAGAIEADEQGQTSVPGVFAAGDVTGRSHEVIGVAAHGARAACAINRTLIHAGDD